MFDKNTAISAVVTLTKTQNDSWHASTDKIYSAFRGAHSLKFTKRGIALIPDNRSEKNIPFITYDEISAIEKPDENSDYIVIRGRDGAEFHWFK